MSAIGDGGFEEEIDISRGDMLVGMDALPGMSTELQARVCWMHPKALQPGRKYFIKHTSHGAQVVVSSIETRINVQTFESEAGARELAMNDIGEIKFRASKPLIFDGYAVNRLTGSFILIEPGTNATVGAGMLLPPIEVVKPEYTDFAI